MVEKPTDNEEGTEPSLLSKFAGTTVMSAVVLCITLQVLNRYVAHIQVSWTEEVSRLLLIWVASIGAILAVSAHAHFRMQLLTGLLSNTARRLLELFITAATLVFLACMLWSGIEFCLDLADNRSQMLGISYAYPMLALPLCAAGMMVALVLRVIAGQRKADRL